MRNPIGDILVVMLLPAHERAVREYFNTIATARLTQIFITLRCYQLEHGKLPDTLEALAPGYLQAIPVDPFNGKPFGYDPTGEAPRMWSVGADQVTDPPGAEGGDDVVVLLTFNGG